MELGGIGIGIGIDKMELTPCLISLIESQISAIFFIEYQILDPPIQPPIV